MNKLILIVSMISLILNGCSSSPPVKFYVLEPITAGKPSVKGYEKQKIIGIGPISVPTMLENKKIVTRLAGNAVQLSDFQQWAAPLPDIILEILTQNLAILQPQHIFRAYPWSAHGTVDQQIIIDIIRFDATPGVTANLEVYWTLKNEQTNTIIRHGHSNLAETLTDSNYSQNVRALSKLLGEFSRELTGILKQQNL